MNFGLKKVLYVAMKKVLPCTKLGFVIAKLRRFNDQDHQDQGL
jgi:hypothetical protein